MFETLQALPPDPILGLIRASHDDPNPAKVDLGAGVYRDARGTTPVPAAVRRAQHRLIADQITKSYVAPPGDLRFLTGLTELLFGPDHPAQARHRIGAVQTPGGCGALRLGAELIVRTRPGARLWASTPTWGNHVPLLGDAGLEIHAYPYLDATRRAVDVDAMLEAVSKLGPDDVLLLHASCHNPCGLDLPHEHWDTVADLAAERGFTPFVDIAYHGLGDGLDVDAHGVRVLARRAPELLIAYSCSKNFGLYRERTGMICAVTPTAETAVAARSQLNAIARGIWSMPPAHGAGIVGLILADADLTAQWRDELAAMRDRLGRLRALLVDRASDRGVDVGHVVDGRGLFSMLDVTPEQVRTLRTDHSIYMLESGRINVAGVGEATVDHLAAGLAAVLPR